VINMEIRDVFRVLRKRWLLVGLLTLGGISAALTASLVVPPQYEARTLSFVSVPSGETSTDLNQGNSYAQSIIQSFVGAVTSPRVLDEVVDDERLDLGLTSAELAENVAASVEPNTVNLTITVTWPDPVLAAEIADAVTRSFRDVAPDLTAPVGGESPVRVTVLTPAEVPEDAVIPNARVNLALGAVIGLALGVAIALLIEVLDTRIRGQRDLEEVPVPVLGGIAYDKRSSKRPLIVQADPSSPAAEAFRTLRTNLQFLDVEGGPRTFVVTSSVPFEGKSTTTANLAIAMAQSGFRVLLIDADLRSPSVAELFGIEGGVGLSDVLIGRVELVNVIQPWGVRNLSLLPAGSMPPNPSELLGSRAMHELLREVETEFDAVLVDSPPLLPVTDAALLARHARGALVAVAAGRTRRAQLTESLEALRQVGARVSGIVLTMVPTRGPDKHGYGRYGYGTTYGAGRVADAFVTSGQTGPGAIVPAEAAVGEAGDATGPRRS
jgi:capsular exopolysaccharide synthesis family protein